MAPHKLRAIRVIPETDPSREEFLLKVALLWRKILNLQQADVFRGSEHSRIDRPHGFDRLPQTGFVGNNYHPGGMLLVGLNPANDTAANGLSREDRRQYAALNRLQDSASDRDAVAASLSLMSILGDDVMPTWKISRIVVAPLLASLHLNLHDVAYINLVKFRTNTSKIGGTILQASWPATSDQIERLSPSLIVALGIGTYNALIRLYRGVPPTMRVQRHNGDARLPDAGYIDIDRIASQWKLLTGKRNS